MRVALDAAALGSGRGGDETLLRGILRGLAEVAAPQDEFRLYVPAGARVPSQVDGHAAFAVERVPRVGGARRLTVTLPLRLARSRARQELVFGITHVPVWGPGRTALLVTDLSFVRHPAHYPRRTRARLAHVVARQVRQAAVVATLSEFCRSDLVEVYGLAPERVAIVPCAVEPPPDRDAATRDRCEAWLLAAGVRRPFVLALGNLHPRKNVARLIAAMARGARAGALEGAQLIVAGARWWGDGDEQRAAAAAPPGLVRFLGRVDDAQREHLLREAAVLAYPSLWEGFGLPPLEAMARGTPVLAADAAAIPEVTGGAAVLVDPLDPDAIAAGLALTLGDPDLRADLRQRGLARAREFTTWRTGSCARAAFARGLATEAPRA